MTALLYLVPVSLILGGVGLFAFFWTVRADQYDDAFSDKCRRYKRQNPGGCTVFGQVQGARWRRTQIGPSL
jgi:cbb3-type cytochrome oxidase maturation protein